ncbi:MAG: type I-MYXAN CRISPR-associated protein Cas5/Cmx5/DevS [Spirochaetia bacterium]|nr:type I-MYXAN CRISPR-associated protein Cas5/Cmx5/DevS [Spirochaetia bacterium]
MHDNVALFVSVPVVSFRVPRAREYFETLPCPPPSTVYGMLLSLVGETNRHAHEGAELAIALLSQPEYSVVLRTLWRVKSRKHGPGLGENKRPDFQELLTHIKLAVWLKKGKNEDAPVCLADRVRQVLATPRTAIRFGGLSLGESTHLVDDLRQLREEDGRHGTVLFQSDEGDLSLPIWADHVGSRGTAWDRMGTI